MGVTIDDLYFFNHIKEPGGLGCQILNFLYYLLLNIYKFNSLTNNILVHPQPNTL
jgi:hypothetical protein